MSALAALGELALGQIPSLPHYVVGDDAVAPAREFFREQVGHVGFAPLGRLALGQGFLVDIPPPGKAPRAPLHPRGTRSLEIPWSALVTAADPDWRRAAHDQVEFEFGGGRRIFRHNPSKRGPYEDDD